MGCMSSDGEVSSRGGHEGSPFGGGGTKDIEDCTRGIKETDEDWGTADNRV